MSYNDVEYGEIDPSHELTEQSNAQQYNEPSRSNSTEPSNRHRTNDEQPATDPSDSVRLYLGNLDLTVKEADIVTLLQPYNIEIISCTFKNNYLKPDQQYCFVHATDTSDNQAQTDRAVQDINDNVIPNLSRNKLRLEKQKPPITCNACGKLGHKASECRGGQPGGGRGRGGYGPPRGYGYPPNDRYHPYGAPPPRGRGGYGPPMRGYEPRGGYRGGYGAPPARGYGYYPPDPYAAPYDPYYAPEEPYYAPSRGGGGGYRGRGPSRGRGGYSNGQPSAGSADYTASYGGNGAPNYQ